MPRAGGHKYGVPKELVVPGSGSLGLWDIIMVGSTFFQWETLLCVEKGRGPENGTRFACGRGLGPGG